MLCLCCVVCLWCTLVVAAKQSLLCDDPSSFDSNYQGDLIYLQILGSNGFHAPLELYPGDPNKPTDWPDGMGKLTKLGMLQQFQLGKTLRSRYKHIVTSDPREVEVFSSEEDRSIQSSLCLLSSLYAPSKAWRFAPNFRWQPIPVTWANGTYDKYVGYNAHCPKIIKEKGQLLKSLAGQTLLKQDEFFYSYWQNHTDLDISNWYDVASLYDTLYRENATGLEIPPWAEEYWSDMERISNLAYKWNHNSKLSLKAKIGALIDLMVDRMRAKTLEDDPNPQTKVNVYMTHDWNIAAFLATLFRFRDVRPPPAATITIELYHYFNTYRVRFLYFNSDTPEEIDANNRPVPLLIRGCSEFCPLAFVTNYFKDYIPKNWNKLCGLRTKIKDSVKDEDVRPFSLSNR